MRKWIHRILKGASLTTALFVFQACYGTPVPAPQDQLSFHVERPVGNTGILHAG